MNDDSKDDSAALARLNHAKSTVSAERRRVQAERETQQVGNANYRTSGRGLVSDLTLAEWRETLAFFAYKCAYCRNNERGRILELGHIVPVSFGGGTTKANCVPTCTQCNMALGTKDPTRARFYVPIEVAHAAGRRVRDFVDANGGLVPSESPVVHFERFNLPGCAPDDPTERRSPYPWETTCAKCRGLLMAICHPFEARFKLPTVGDY